MSIGSGELPSDFDIFRPWPSRTMLFRYTSRNGDTPVNSYPAITMRATQKKMMSAAVTNVSVG